LENHDQKTKVGLLFVAKQLLSSPMLRDKLIWSK